MARPAPADPALEGEIIEIIAASPAAPTPQPGDVRDRIEPLDDIRCVLFDVYGTLFTSASGDVGTAQTASNDNHFALALQRSGFVLRRRDTASEARRRYFDEIRRRHAEGRTRGIEHPEVDIGDVWSVVLSDLERSGVIGRSRESDEFAAALRTAAWYEVLANPVAPMPFARSTLDGLRSAELLLGIVSNAQFYTPLLFPALMGTEHTALGFRDDLCSWSFRLGEAKPSPEIFAPVLDRLARSEGVSPHGILYVGNDMLNDVWTAHEAGCRTALFGGDVRSLRLRRDDPRCSNLRPDIVALKLSDLLKALAIAPPDGAEGNTE